MNKAHTTSQTSSLVVHADGGINMSQQQREQVDSLLEQLESVGSQQQPRPLDNSLLYGNYNVAYTSTSRAQSERGQRESIPTKSLCSCC